MNEFLDQFGGLKASAKAGILVGVAVFTAVINYFLFFAPIEEEYMSLLNQRATAEEKKVEYDGLSRTLEMDRQINKEIDLMLNEKKGRLPDTTELESIMRELHRRASDSGVRIASFLPKSEIIKELYVEQPISLILEASFHDTLNFLYGVSQNTRIINMDDILMESPEYRNQKVIISSKLDIKVYRFRKDSDKLPEDKTKKPASAGKSGKE